MIEGLQKPQRADVAARASPADGALGPDPGQPRRLPTSHSATRWGPSRDPGRQLPRAHSGGGWGGAGQRPRSPSRARPTPRPGRRASPASDSRPALRLARRGRCPPARAAPGAPGVKSGSHASAPPARRRARAQARAAPPLHPSQSRATPGSRRRCRPAGGAGGRRGGRRARGPRPPGGRVRRRSCRRAGLRRGKQPGGADSAAAGAAPAGPGEGVPPEAGRPGGRSLARCAALRLRALRPGLRAAPRRLRRDEAPVRGDDLGERPGRDHRRGEREQLLGVSARARRELPGARARRRGALCGTAPGNPAGSWPHGEGPVLAGETLCSGGRSGACVELGGAGGPVLTRGRGRGWQGGRWPGRRPGCQHGAGGRRTGPGPGRRLPPRKRSEWGPRAKKKKKGCFFNRDGTDKSCFYGEIASSLPGPG